MITMMMMIMTAISVERTLMKKDNDDEKNMWFCRIISVQKMLMTKYDKDEWNNW